MRVSEVMSRDFATVAPDDTLQVAAQLMADLDTDALPVGDANTLQGIVTGRDIVLRAVACCLDPCTTKVSEVMSAQVVVCRPDDSADEVENKMAEHQIRRMPVIDADGRVIGMVQSTTTRQRLPQA